MPTTRFELPNSAGTACELFFEGSKVEIKFFSADGKNLGSKSFLMVSIKEDDIVNHLASADVNFTTFSALYDGAGLILEKAKELKESGGESDRKIVLRRKTEGDESDEPPSKKDSTPVMDIPEGGPQPLSFETKDLGKIIHHFPVPYANNVYIYLFQVTKLSYNIVIEKDGKEAFRYNMKKIPSENDVYPILQESKLPDLESMTVMFDVAEVIVKTCASADSYAREVSDELKERVELSRDLSAYRKALEAKKQAEKSESERLEPSTDTSTSSSEEASRTESQGVQEEKEPKKAEKIQGEFLLEFKVPYSESHVNFYLFNGKVTAVFYKESTEASRKEIENVPTEDEAYAMVDESGITDTFSSMSLIYDVAEKIVEVCTDPESFLPKEEEIKEDMGTESESSLDSSVSDTAVSSDEEIIEEEDESKQELRKIIESGTFVTEMNIPYSHETSVKVYWDEENNQFVLRFWRNQKEVDLIGTDNNLDEDQAWEIFNSANIEFISMSVIYDAAEDLIDIVKDPESKIKVEKAADLDDESFEGFQREEEEELPVDFDQFTKPEHIEPLLAEIKKSLAKAKSPIQVMEQKIETMPKVGFKVFRQGEDIWLIDFFEIKSGKILTQRPAKLKEITSDEVFKAVNNGIPQVTLSAVSDASEVVYNVIKHLADRPADDLAFNQVVAHFEKVIAKHEEQNEINDAIDLISGLMAKLEELGNPLGVSKFGLKLSKLFESQNKTADSARQRLDLIPKLIQMNDLQALREYIDDSLEFFTKVDSRPLDAAQVSVDFAEVVLKRKDLILAMKYIKEASTLFKEAKITRALADHNFRFAKLYLQLLRGDEPEGFFEETLSGQEKADSGAEEQQVDLPNLSDADDPFADLGDDPFADLADEDSTTSSDELNEKSEIHETDTPSTEQDESLPDPLTLFDIKEKSLESLLQDTEELFKGALLIYDENKEYTEYLDALTEIILLYRKYEFLDQEITFGEMGVSALKDSKQIDRALRLCLQLMDKLIVKDGDITKGLEFFNDAVKMFYQKEQWTSALDLGIKVIPNLILYAEKDVTLEYIGFAHNMVDRIYPQPSEDALGYYLKISRFYAKVKKNEESLAILSKAISFKKNNIQDLLNFCHDYSVQYLENEDWSTARDFINSSLNVIGSGDYPTIFKVAYQFFIDLSTYKNFQLANEYLTYAYQLTGQLPDPLNAAGDLVIKAIKHYLSIENVDIKQNINPLLPILKAYYSQTKKFKEIKDILMPIIEKQIAKELWDDVVENTRDLSVYLQHGKDQITAGKILFEIRNKVIGKVSKDIVREFTDNAIKLAVNDSPEGQQLGIEILDSVIEYLVNNGEYSDAYLYTVQAVKYFENLTKISEANVFLEEKRALFEDKNRDQDANSLTDLMIRLAKQNSQNDKAADLAYQAYQKNRDKQLWDAAYGYLTDSANSHLKLDKKGQKSDQLLTEGFNVFITQNAAEEETDELISEIVKFRQAKKKWSDRDILEFYKSVINQTLEFDNVKLLNKTVTKTISLIKSSFPDDFYQEMTEIISKLVEAGKHKESHPYVSDLIVSYIHDFNFVRDLLFYYVKAYLQGNEVEIAQKLVEMVLEKSKSDSGNIIRITMRFVQMLAEYRMSGQARAYIDKIVSNLFPTKSMDQTQSTAVATIYDKFSSMVIRGSPELAIEYGYKAADLYRKVNNGSKIIEIYKNLASEIEEEETVRSVLKRGTNQADQMRIPFKDQSSLHTQLVLKAFETKAPNASREFKQVLSLLEKNNMLPETLNYLQESMYRMIRNSEFDLFYNYIEYLTTLVDGLKGETKGIKILVQLAARYYNKKKDKGKVKKLKSIYDSLNEPNPSDELLAHFLRTGELELPEKELIIEEPVVKEEIAPPLATEVTSESADTTKALEEVEASASSLEDELVELGGDELSQALANAISQLSTDSILDEDIAETAEESAPKKKSLLESLEEESEVQELSSFDSLSELEEEEQTSEPSLTPSIDPEDEESLQNIFSSALNDLTSAFGMADLNAASEDDDSSTSSAENVRRGDGSLTLNEEQVYLAINKQYSRVMKGKDFYQALEEWKGKLPKLLKEHNLSEAEWEKLSEKGDKDEKLSDYLASITK